MKTYAAFLVGLLGPLPLLAQEASKAVAPGTPVMIHVIPAPAAAPTVSLTLAGRHGHVTPHREGCVHTGAGNIDIAQPSPDTVIVTMTGVAVAVGSCCHPGVAGMDFDLEQCFEVVFEKPEVKAAKLTLEGRVIGLLRSQCPCLAQKAGTAEETHGCATVVAGPHPLLTLCVPDHGVAGGENLSINDHEGPIAVPIAAGKYTLHQVWHILAAHPKTCLPCKAASAEFAPDPALDPLWISYWEPFHGIVKKDFGFQVTLKVAADEGNGNNKATKAENLKIEPRKDGGKKPPVPEGILPGN